jgi:hypothetical protein
MNIADLEIAALRRAEARMTAQFVEVDQLCRKLMNHYACNFIIGDIPDRAWLDPVTIRPRLQEGMPPRDRKGYVVVSLSTLRELGEKVS